MLLVAEVTMEEREGPDGCVDTIEDLIVSWFESRFNVDDTGKVDAHNVRAVLSKALVLLQFSLASSS